MKQFILILLTAILIFSSFSLVACGNESVELSTTEIEVAVDKYEAFNFTASEKSKFEVVSSDENIASVSSTQRSSGNTSNYVITTIKGKSNGKCNITVKVGNTTKTVNVKVGFIPEIKLLQTDDYSFHVETNFPVGTILTLTLKDNDYSSSQYITLEKKSWYYSYQNFTVEDVMNGTYTLSLKLDDFTNQPQETQSKLGNSGEFILGEYVNEKDSTKMFEATYSFDLPYVSTEEKIAATDYISLTNEQKLFIKQWIDKRYDYYDEIEGKYTGNKYTKTIFNEAAALFNKTYSQIDSIWGDPDIPLYN